MIRVSDTTISGQMCIIDGRWERDRFGAARIQMAQIESELLDAIRREHVLVINDPVIGRSSSSKTGLMAVKEEIEMVWVHNACVDYSTRKNIS